MILLRPCECRMKSGFLGLPTGITRLCPTCLGFRTDADWLFALGAISRKGAEWRPVVPVDIPDTTPSPPIGVGRAFRTRAYLIWVAWTYRYLLSFPR